MQDGNPVMKFYRQIVVFFLSIAIITIGAPVIYAATSGQVYEDASNVEADIAVKWIAIGDWNMDTTSTIAVAHGLDLAKIGMVSVMIRNDADTARYQLIGYDSATLPANVDVIDATNVNLFRRTGDAFDNANFDATGYNRGIIRIEYGL
jgi:hypothetical protein